MRRVARRHSIPYRVLWALRYRKPRDVFASVYFRLHAAYEAECERQMRQLKDELEKTRQIAGADSRAVRAAEALVAKADQ